VSRPEFSELGRVEQRQDAEGRTRALEVSAVCYYYCIKSSIYILFLYFSGVFESAAWIFIFYIVSGIVFLF